MANSSYWVREENCESVSFKEASINLLKNVWLGVLLLALGAAAFTTAAILAYPVIANYAAKAV